VDEVWEAPDDAGQIRPAQACERHRAGAASPFRGDGGARARRAAQPAGIVQLAALGIGTGQESRSTWSRCPSIGMIAIPRLRALGAPLGM